MISNSNYILEIGRLLEKFRCEKNLSTETVEDILIIGRGWIKALENGNFTPSFELIANLLNIYDKSFYDLTKNLNYNSIPLKRSITCESSFADLNIIFEYNKFNASYTLSNTKLEVFEKIIKSLKNGLSKSIGENGTNTDAVKANSVAESFLLAVKLLPHINPSDIWYFIIYRAYCDMYNHPADYLGTDLAQSWRRTGGWALEKVVLKHYGNFLSNYGIKLIIPKEFQKTELIKDISEKISHRIETDKIDIFITYKGKFAGIVNVKASFAERRTDDVPLSQALLNKGYISPLWTLDCKSTPSKFPVNKGELGSFNKANAKRKDIEEDGYFSACFSYNQNTTPTPQDAKVKSKIYICNFKDPNDEFSNFLIRSITK